MVDDMKEKNITFSGNIEDDHNSLVNEGFRTDKIIELIETWYPKKAKRFLSQKKYKNKKLKKYPRETREYAIDLHTNRKFSPYQICKIIKSYYDDELHQNLTENTIKEWIKEHESIKQISIKKESIKKEKVAIETQQSLTELEKDEEDSISFEETKIKDDLIFTKEGKNKEDEIRKQRAIDLLNKGYNFSQIKHKLQKKFEYLTTEDIYNLVKDEKLIKQLDFIHVKLIKTPLQCVSRTIELYNSGEGTHRISETLNKEFGRPIYLQTIKYWIKKYELKKEKKDLKEKKELPQKDIKEYAIELLHKGNTFKQIRDKIQEKFGYIQIWKIYDLVKDEQIIKEINFIDVTRVHFSIQSIIRAIDLYLSGKSSKEISKILTKEFNIQIKRQLIENWILKYETKKADGKELEEIKEEEIDLIHNIEKDFIFLLNEKMNLNEIGETLYHIYGGTKTQEFLDKVKKDKKLLEKITKNNKNKINFQEKQAIIKNNKNKIKQYAIELLNKGYYFSQIQEKIIDKFVFMEIGEIYDLVKEEKIIKKLNFIDVQRVKVPLQYIVRAIELSLTIKNKQTISLLLNDEFNINKQSQVVDYWIRTYKKKIKEKNLKKNNNGIRCPKCNSQKTIKSGKRESKLGEIQRFRCKKCNYKFIEKKAEETIKIERKIEIVDNLGKIEEEMELEKEQETKDSSDEDYKPIDDKYGELMNEENIIKKSYAIELLNKGYYFNQIQEKFNERFGFIKVDKIYDLVKEEKIIKQLNFLNVKRVKFPLQSLIRAIKLSKSKISHRKITQTVNKEFELNIHWQTLSRWIRKYNIRKEETIKIERKIEIVDNLGKIEEEMELEKEQETKDSSDEEYKPIDDRHDELIEEKEERGRPQKYKDVIRFNMNFEKELIGEIEKYKEENEKIPDLIRRILYSYTNKISLTKTKRKTKEVIIIIDELLIDLLDRKFVDKEIEPKEVLNKISKLKNYMKYDEKYQTLIWVLEIIWGNYINFWNEKFYYIILKKLKEETKNGN